MPPPAVETEFLTRLAERRAEFEAQLAEHARSIETVLGTHSRLGESVLYSLRSGGKRIRPILVLEVCRTCGGTAAAAAEPGCPQPGYHPTAATDAAVRAAIAVECVHTFSLIHDDLPAMDDDDLRRGVPTNHKVFGEAVAILAGDWLLAHAFALLRDAGVRMPSDDAGARTPSRTPDAGARADAGARIISRTPIAPESLDAGARILSRTPIAPESLPVDAATSARLSAELAQAVQAMIAGQAADIAGQSSPPDAARVEFIHRHKTARLIECCCRMGAICAAASPAGIEAVATYGRHLGLAFQIRDDLLDLTATSAQLGKRTCKDARESKQTFPAIHGIDESRRRAEQEVDAAIAALARFGSEADMLRCLARFILTRER